MTIENLSIDVELSESYVASSASTTEAVTIGLGIVGAVLED
jgi:hypothetical protein